MVHAREYLHMAANPCVGKVTYKPARRYSALESYFQRAVNNRLANVALRPTNNYLIYSCELIGLKANGTGLFV